ncbi:MAG: hypothetical protein IJT30_04530 [Muribaculaceae bacterium]|nr:hypothetical protein [Muribaculaceae bacterium]
MRDVETFTLSIHELNVFKSFVFQTANLRFYIDTANAYSQKKLCGRRVGAAGEAISLGEMMKNDENTSVPATRATAFSLRDCCGYAQCGCSHVIAMLFTVNQPFESMRASRERDDAHPVNNFLQFIVTIDILIILCIAL